jgi:hypothetical protein
LHYSFVTPTNARLTHTYVALCCCCVLRRHLRYLQGDLHQNLRFNTIHNQHNVTLQHSCYVTATMLRYSIHVTLQHPCYVTAFMLRYSIHVTLQHSCYFTALMLRYSIHATSANVYNNLQCKMVQAFFVLLQFSKTTKRYCLIVGILYLLKSCSLTFCGRFFVCKYLILSSIVYGCCEVCCDIL